MVDIQKPTSEFRQYIEWEGRWRHVYIKSTHFQTRLLLAPPIKMVEFALTKNSKTLYSAERSRFHDNKPKKRKENSGIA